MWKNILESSTSCSKGGPFLQTARFPSDSQADLCPPTKLTICLILMQIVSFLTFHPHSYFRILGFKPKTLKNISLTQELSGIFSKKFLLPLTKSWIMLAISNQRYALGSENLGWWFPHISHQAENINNLLCILFATQAEYHNLLPPQKISKSQKKT